ncbi:hypothetical protein TNCV_4642741 [Trichonephila clavipes]|nr:hypothetical protein TNCV_4642741 [Trichonephila clavipes]
MMVPRPTSIITRSFKRWQLFEPICEIVIDGAPLLRVGPGPHEVKGSLFRSSGLNSVVVGITDSCLVCHEFDPGVTED